MASVTSCLIIVVLALGLQAAHSAAVRSDNVASAEDRVAVYGTVDGVDFEDMFRVYNSGTNDVNRRFKRQTSVDTDVDDSEIFSDGPGTSINVHSLPMSSSDDIAENNDASNIVDDDDITISDYTDGEGVDQPVDDKKVEKGPEVPPVEQEKEIGRVSGSADIPEGEINSSSGVDENKLEEVKSDDRVKLDEGMKLDEEPLSDGAVESAESEEEEVGEEVGDEEKEEDEEEEEEDDAVKSKEVDRLDGESTSVTTDKLEEGDKPRNTVDVPSTVEDIMKNEKEDKEDEYEYEDEDEKGVNEDEVLAQSNSAPIAVSEPLATPEDLKIIETLPSEATSSETSSRQKLEVKDENIYGSGYSDSEDSNETGELDLHSGEVIDENGEATHKNTEDSAQVKTTSEDATIDLDDNLIIGKTHEDSSTLEPVDSFESSTTSHSSKLNEEQGTNIDDADPISDPNETSSENKQSGSELTPPKNDIDSDVSDLATGLKADELIIVPSVVPTIEAVEGSGSGGGLGDSDDTSEESDSLQINPRNLAPIPQAPPSSDVGADKGEESGSENVSSAEETERSGTNEDSENPDTVDPVLIIEKPIAPVKDTPVNANPEVTINVDEIGADNTNIDNQNESIVVHESPESVADADNKQESINEIGVKTDEKEEVAAETNDTSISSGSFIILGAIMVAIISLLGYTVMKSHRQKQRQRDARKAKEDDPGTELKEIEKLLTPHQNGNGPGNGVAEKDGLLCTQVEEDAAKPATVHHYLRNGDIPVGIDQPTLVNIPPKMMNGNTIQPATEQSAQIPESVSVDLRYLPQAAAPYAVADVLQAPSSSSCSLNSVDDRGSWVYGTTPLETTKIKMFIDEDSIPKTPIVIVKRGGATVEV